MSGEKIRRRNRKDPAFDIKSRKLLNENTQLHLILDCLMNSLDEPLTAEGTREKISSWTSQLRQHLEDGYPLPDLRVTPVPAGASTDVVLKFLANECSRIRREADEAKNKGQREKTDETGK
ncbi:MAG: hypothetical protein ACFWTZ_06720 [Burkholderia sp.]|jgi:hypothetical protein